MTDKEIIKAFEEKVNLISTMTSVYLDEVEGLNLYETMNNTLDLINRQQKQLDNYSHNVRNLTKESLEFMKTIKKQQEEIEIHQADSRRLVSAYKQCAYERDVLLEMVGEDK